MICRDTAAAAAAAVAAPAVAAAAVAAAAFASADGFAVDWKGTERALCLFLSASLLDRMLAVFMVVFLASLRC